jgi:hypothetical protein
MKSIIKLSLLLISLSLNAAQLTGTLTSTIEVVDGISLDDFQDLDFGVAYQGETVSVVELSTCQDMYDDTTIGRIHMTAVSNGQSLTLTSTVPTDLTHTDGTTTLPLTIDTWWCQGPSNAPDKFSSNTKDVLGREDTATTNLVDWTGLIDIPTTQKIGIYTGVIDFLLEY